MSSIEDIKAKWNLKLEAEKQKAIDKINAKMSEVPTEFIEKETRKAKKADDSAFEKLQKFFEKPLPRELLTSIVANLEAERVNETIAICNKLLQEKEA